MPHYPLPSDDLGSWAQQAAANSPGRRGPGDIGIELPTRSLAHLQQHVRSRLHPASTKQSQCMWC